MSRGLRYRAGAVALMGGLIVGSLAACGQAASPANPASDTAVPPAATGDTCPKTAPLMPVNTRLTSGTELLKRSLPASNGDPLPAATGGLLCIYDTDWPGPLMRHTKLNVATATKITAMIENLPKPKPDNRPTSCPGFPTVPPIWIHLYLGGHAVIFTYLGDLPDCGGIVTSDSMFYPQNDTATQFEPLAKEIERLAGGSPTDLRAFSTQFSNASSP